jgi:anti-sigma regulatory factor (Ser/Thr protein kinase)
MLLPSKCVLQVSHPSDAYEARCRIKSMAVDLGFSLKESEDLAIVVSELSSNLVRHAGGGQLVFTPLTKGITSGIKIVSQDKGPGIAEVNKAIVDGFSTSGTLGYGLGTIKRLMDQLYIEPSPEEQPGTLITCVKWSKNPGKAVSCPLSFGSASRTRPDMSLNGDSVIIRQWNNSALLALIDGLGHGKYAHEAARAAREYIETHYDQPLPLIFRGVGKACRATRGVVMALARFDWGEGAINLSFARVGNISAKVFNYSQPMSFPEQRGIIGFNAPEPITAKYRWEPSQVLVLHTDGLTTAWRWTDFPKLAEASAPYTAEYLLQKLARDDDDASVLVVRGS